MKDFFCNCSLCFCCDVLVVKFWKSIVFLEKTELFDPFICMFVPEFSNSNFINSCLAA